MTPAEPLLTRRPLDLDGSVELAVLERAGLIESRHVGAAVVVAPDGSVLRELGDSAAEIYPRSSLKLLQAVAVLRAGAGLEGERAVLATASHAGTDEHVRVVRDILALAGATEDDLGCPADWPLDRDAAYSARQCGDGKRRITMNCSGKHASFLLACAVNAWPTAGYLDPAHPLQQLIRSTIEDLTGEGVGTVGIDGCGAPVFGTSLRGLATAVGRISGAARNGGDPLAAGLAAAILADGWAIDGPGRATTVVIERLGLVAKNGAEGVMVVGAPDGTAVAVKALDGSNRATTLVALKLLVSVGALDPALADAVIADTTERVLGGGQPVGELRASAALSSLSLSPR